IGLIVSGATLFLEGRIPFLPFEHRLEQIGARDFKLPESWQEIALPPPLRGSVEPEITTLSRSGIFFWTNEHRKINGLAALESNAVLDEAAKAKLGDMFEYQYFAHVSPAGRGVGDWVGDQQYEFITIGENLALGNYKDDKALVQAWMDSPGHRANILNTKYREIGIAVGRGAYEGQQTWLAVQIFGLPLTVCPFAGSELRSEIEKQKTKLDPWGADLDAQYQELKKSGSRRDPEYVQEVQDYNASADAYNKAVADMKAMIERYNAQLKEQQACLAEFDA
ncbi:MAG: hypothetical protein HY603_01410, partial [Parcubacteria group bacterium]|nr:hypothetical protein [Parcubacteria group bacterium]